MNTFSVHASHKMPIDTRSSCACSFFSRANAWGAHICSRIHCHCEKRKRAAAVEDEICNVTAESWHPCTEFQRPPVRAHSSNSAAYCASPLLRQQTSRAIKAKNSDPLHLKNHLTHHDPKEKSFTSLAGIT